MNIPVASIIMRVARNGRLVLVLDYYERGATMHNEKIRSYAKNKRVKLWQIAEALGQQDSSFSKMLRHELPTETQHSIMAIIDKLAGEGDGNNG